MKKINKSLIVLSMAAIAFTGFSACTQSTAGVNTDTTADASTTAEDDSTDTSSDKTDDTTSQNTDDTKSDESDNKKDDEEGSEAEPENKTPVQSDYYGTYSGNWNVMGTDYPMTFIAAENTFYCESSMMTLAYEHVWWTTDDDGNFVCNGNHVTDSTASGYETAASTGTFTTVDGTKTAEFAVVAMAALGDPASLTYESSVTDLPASFVVDGSYSEDVSGSIVSLAANMTVATMSASDVTVKITRTEDTVTLSIPSISGQFGATTMTIPAFEITEVKVALSSDKSKYEISIGDYTENSVSAVTSSSEPIFTTTVTVDDTEKAIKVYALDGTVTDGVLALNMDYLSGTMPMHAQCTYTAHVEAEEE